MTNHGQDADQPEFKVEDEIDLLFGRGNPNPTRVRDAPLRDVPKALSRRALPPEHPGVRAPRELFALFSGVPGDSAGSRGAARYMSATVDRYAAAAVVALAIAGSWFVLRRSGSPADGGQPTSLAPEQSARLDLRPFAVTRSEERTAEPEGLVLPRGRLNVTILLPVGSQPGEDQIQILDADLQARASARGTAAIRDFVTTLEASLDLNSLPMGSYGLALRRQGGDWRFFPAQLR